ncbi:MAG: ATP-binding protein [Lachnospiraceae bacterium]|nr:ATP-binding protein [Lachnospiraceae bacterium]
MCFVNCTWFHYTISIDKYLYGIGLQSVNTIVEKYNGLLEIEHNDQEFTVSILLYI